MTDGLHGGFFNIPTAFFFPEREDSVLIRLMDWDLAGRPRPPGHCRRRRGDGPGARLPVPAVLPSHRWGQGARPGTPRILPPVCPGARRHRLSLLACHRQGIEVRPRAPQPPPSTSWGAGWVLSKGCHSPEPRAHTSPGGQCSGGTAMVFGQLTVCRGLWLRETTGPGGERAI